MYKLPLYSKRKFCGKFALIDDDDKLKVLLASTRWTISRACPYPFGHNDGKTIYLHTLIKQAPPGMMIDHKDRDKLNCQKENLRAADHSQNGANTSKSSRSEFSKYKGVTIARDGNGWRANIVHNKVMHSLGTYDSELEAAHAYNVAATKLFAEFASLNDVPSMTLNPRSGHAIPTSGYIGVTFTRGRYWARVGRHSVGRFDTAEEASQARALWIANRNAPKKKGLKLPILANLKYGP